MYGLFMWSRYYSNGGTGDYVGCFGTKAAIEAAREHKDFNDRYEVMSSFFNSMASGYTNEL